MPRPLATNCRMATVSSAVRLFGLMPAGVKQCFIRSSISSGTGYVISVSPAKSSASSHCLDARG